MDINNKDIEEKLKQIFESVGVYVNAEDYNERIVIDSLQFVSVIIAIEEELMIRISEDHYDYSDLQNFSDYIEIVGKFIA